MARRAGYKAGYITHYASPKRLVAVLMGVELVVRRYYQMTARGYSVRKGWGT